MNYKERSEQRIARGLKEGEFVVNKAGKVVCSFCGGNCGQCGYTDVLGCDTPASMQTMVDNLYSPNRKKSRSRWVYLFLGLLPGLAVCLYAWLRP